MDPATAFGIAAGVIQVVDVSFRAVATCRELYKDGSLAKHKDTEQVTKYLSDTSNQLQKLIEGAPAPMSQEDKDVIELSKKCSSTANDLINELGKFKLDPQHSFRQAMKKSIRTLRKGGDLDEIQKRLEKYQKVLDTRILARLQASSIKHTEAFHSLDKNMQDVINSFQQHLADQGKMTRDHIDRQRENHNHASRLEQQLEKFQESLFFPEIHSRKERISDAHRGTCSWIFGPPESNIASQAESDNDGTDDEAKHDGRGSDAPDSEQIAKVTDDGEEGIGRNAKGNGSCVKPPPWSNFLEWLEHGHGVYWINGKAGSGKSTLMSYLTDHERTTRALETWANGSDLLTPSFFFWNPGTELQKSSQGLLRSLLYQIVDHGKSEFFPMAASQVRTMHEWTERALLSKLKDFLIRKPASLSLCFFIDGLDEFVGEQDTLLQAIKLLQETPRVKVCVSSRPELIFGRAFQNVPQLRLQDFNQKDIEKTAKDKLYPELQAYLPREKDAVERLMLIIVYKAEGVFLWFQLVVKDMIKGAQNQDTMEMLFTRLQRMPHGMENLYQHMLGKQDRLYQQEATAYFHFVANPSILLVHFVFIDPKNGAWDHVLANDYNYLDSEEFDALCKRLENRIGSCCAGLVEIDKDYPKRLPQVHSYKRDDYRTMVPLQNCNARQSKSRQLRGVRFIHRSVLEFLNQQTEFLDYQQDVAADLTLARCQLGFIALLPILVTSDTIRPEVVLVLEGLEMVMKVASSLDERTIIVDRETPVYQLMTQIDQVAQQVHLRLNPTERSWYITHFHYTLCNDLSGIAALFGLNNYVAYHLDLLHDYPLEVLNYLLHCAVTGLKNPSNPLGRSLRTINTLLDYSAEPDWIFDALSKRGTSEVRGTDITKISAWSIFLTGTVRKIAAKPDPNMCLPWLPLWTAAVKFFLSNNADVNTTVFTDITFSAQRRDDNSILLEESPLSLIDRETVHGASHPLEELSKLLKSKGGLERTCCRFIQFTSFGKNRYEKRLYRVSENISDRLLGYIRGSSLEAPARVIEEVKASLTEDDMVHEEEVQLGEEEFQVVEEEDEVGEQMAD